MRCIHCKYNKETRKYDSLIDISDNNGKITIKCRQCGMILTALNYIIFIEVIDPWHRGFVARYSIPSIKTIEKNLESSGLLGPEIEVDD